MTGRIRITYRLQRASDNKVSYLATLTYGHERISYYIHAEGDTLEYARAQVINKFRDIPEPESLIITPNGEEPWIEIP